MDVAAPAPTRMNPRSGGQIIDLRSSPSNQTVNGKYRRNGKLQSCEPCRKSKLRCDHVVPTCSRCVRRKCADKCVYHPNPLTKNRSLSDRPSAELAPPTPSTTTNEDSPPWPYPSIEPPESREASLVRRELPQKSDPEDTAQVAELFPRAASAPPLRGLRCEVGPYRKNPGFFGSTNYMSIFSEIPNLGVASTDLDEGIKLARVLITDDHINRGCQLLTFLKDSALIHDFINRFYDIGHGAGIVCIEPVMKQWLTGLWMTHSDTLKKRNPEKMRRLSELLWRNTLTTISVNENTDYKGWALQATGQNIRWEVIGLIAASIGQCASSLSRSDLLFTQHKVSKPVIARKMSSIASTCLEFCRETESVDDLFLWLLSENGVLTETIRGVGSFAAYRESGELINAVVAMGLHIDVKQGKPHIPFFLEQMRKHTLTGAYSSDVGTSSYLGRPNRLSHRYCNLVPPLDVTYDQMIAEPEEIKRIVASLDKHGFNTSGKFSRATWLKIWLGFSPIREDVLDLALGRYTREETLRRADEIHRQTAEYELTLPQFVRNLPSDPIDFGDHDAGRKRSPLETLYQFSCRQCFRGNELLLQRVLIRKTGAKSDKLIQVAVEIFDDIMQISKRTDISSIFQADMYFLLSAQGLRSAAVIAVELLKQEQLPNYPKNPLLPRSRTIQDLSVFAARLGDIDPSDGSYMVSEQGRKVITRILDKILSPPSSTDRLPAIPTQHEQQHHLTQMEMDVMTGEPAPHQDWHMTDPLDMQMISDTNLGMGIEMPFLGHDNDFMQWLENVDWERPM
ncbi:hypothetical protein GGR57DRAFT_481412 [Xylariaceae sp. FL1272]|nr:hypothetical protein GGR57DRAFT_481412 [Xylariaceae sp. FL1272]